MYKAGVINGMDDTHFAPDGTVTKGQFATLIVNALKIDTDSSLASEHWAMPFVKAARLISSPYCSIELKTLNPVLGSFFDTNMISTARSLV